MLQRDDVQRGVEGGVAEGQARQIGERVEGGVVPGGVADAEIDARVALAGENAACTGLRRRRRRARARRAGSDVEKSRTACSIVASKW